MVYFWIWFVEKGILENTIMKKRKKKKWKVKVITISITEQKEGSWSGGGSLTAAASLMQQKGMNVGAGLLGELLLIQSYNIKGEEIDLAARSEKERIPTSRSLNCVLSTGIYRELFLTSEGALITIINLILFAVCA